MSTKCVSGGISGREKPAVEGEKCGFPPAKIDKDSPNLDFPRFANPATLHAPKCKSAPPGLVASACGNHGV